MFDVRVWVFDGARWQKEWPKDKRHTNHLAFGWQKKEEEEIAHAKTSNRSSNVIWLYNYVHVLNNKNEDEKTEKKTKWNKTECFWSSQTRKNDNWLLCDNRQLFFVSKHIKTGDNFSSGWGDDFSCKHQFTVNRITKIKTKLFRMFIKSSHRRRQELFNSNTGRAPSEHIRSLADPDQIRTSE